MSQHPPLEEMTLRQLRRVASEYEVSRYSRMRKSELIDSIRAIETQRGLVTVATPVMTTSPAPVESQTEVEASKYSAMPAPAPTAVAVLATVDEGLSDLPSGYGESRIVLMPRDPQWTYAYWDIPNAHKEELRRQGGMRLALRFYDVTEVDLGSQSPHSLQQYECDELAREWYLPVPVSDRDYVVEIGYVCNDGRWLVLARSFPVHIPPVYPSDWMEDHFMTVDFSAELKGQTLMTLTHPSRRIEVGGTAAAEGNNPIYDGIFALAESAEAQRVVGSLFGSMQHVTGSGQMQAPPPMPMQTLPEQAISSYVFPSGVGMWAVPTMSGLTMSGAGFSASAPPIRPRQFWLVADAELIVYGATEPDATVTIGGKPIKLNPDGTFRFQMSFQDGLIDYPIMAVAADGEQTRSVHMKFTRETPSRNTNTKEDAVVEWLN